MMEVDDSSCFATPQPRQGPTSRLLKRRSQIPASLLTPKESAAEDPPSFATSVHNSVLGDEHVANYTYGMMDATAPPTMMNFTASKAADLSRSILTADETTYGVSAAGLRATDNLYVDFLATIVDETRGLETLEQVVEFEELLSGQLEGLGSRTDDSAKQLRHVFSSERSTWRLLGRLYHDRLSREDDEEEMPSRAAAISEKTLVSGLFRRDRELREGQIVVDWLEANARDAFEESSASRLDFAPSPGLVHDPDARRREGKALPAEDAEEQERLLKATFLCVRAGLLETAQELCCRAGQPWRAAVLEGWKLFHDPNMDRAGREVALCEGNPRRDVWKKVVWRMIGDDAMGLRERAVLAPFCGHLRFLLAACAEDWEDWLWAHAKCMVDVRVEREIRGAMARRFAELPKEYWTESRRSFGEVFEAIEGSESPVVRRQAATPYRVVQKHLVLGSVEEMLRALDGEEPEDPQLLRFLAHLVVVLRRVGAADGLTGLNPVRRYVLYLMAKDRVQQVAWYTALLPREDQVGLYARMLEGIKVDADRRLAITLALESRLPVEEIKRRVVDNVVAGVDVDDGTKVDALTWLLYDGRQRAEAVRRANGLMRSFVAAERFDSARAACAKIPEEGDEGGRSNDLKELRCWRLYFRAKEGFADWFEHFHKARPEEPMRPGQEDGATFTETVAFEQRSKRFQVEMERWEATQEVQSAEARDRLAACLTASGGWLVDEVDDEDDGDDQRRMEVEYLRKVCLPQLVLLLHSVLHSTGRFGRAVRIADLVASDRHRLYEAYLQEDMRELLGKVRESAVEAMAKGSRDAWDYPIDDGEGGEGGDR